MQDITEYMKRSQEDRQKHLQLDEPCLERGAPKSGVSSYCKALLAHILDTTIPTGRYVHVCHACNNSNCSNPVHLYWGSPKENRLDRIKIDNRTIWDNMVAKYGEDGARALNAKGKHGNTHGTAHKGKPKSDGQKRKTSESLKEYHRNNDHASKSSGRKPNISYNDIIDVYERLGKVDGSKFFGLSEQAFYARYRTAKRNNG